MSSREFLWLVGLSGGADWLGFGSVWEAMLAGVGWGCEQVVNKFVWTEGDGFGRMWVLKLAER